MRKIRTSFKNLNKDLRLSENPYNWATLNLLTITAAPFLLVLTESNKRPQPA